MPIPLKRILSTFIIERIVYIMAITKTDLANRLSETMEVSKKDATQAISAIVDFITDALYEGEQVRISDFGTFEIRDRAARTGRNPKTGESIEIPASKAVGFKVAKALKEAVNKY